MNYPSDPGRTRFEIIDLLVKMKIRTLPGPPGGRGDNKLENVPKQLGVGGHKPGPSAPAFTADTGPKPAGPETGSTIEQPIQQRPPCQKVRRVRSKLSSVPSSTVYYSIV